MSDVECRHGLTLATCALCKSAPASVHGPPTSRDIALGCEVGGRVRHALMGENHPQASQRRSSVKKRARRAIGEWIPPTAPNNPRAEWEESMERLCHACLRADAQQRDEYARNLADKGNYTGAQKEADEAKRLRGLVANSLHRPCVFHRHKPRRRREQPTPNSPLPGLLEMDA